MPVVVDASAVAAVVFDEPDGRTISAHLEDETLLAPHLLDVELLNTAIVKIRRSFGDPLLITMMLSTVHRLHIRRLPIRAHEVGALALRTGLSGYDASYLWLAVEQDAELVTLDRALAKADRLLRGDPA
jgi:predicted nucleic acid-binding protein